MCAVEVGGGIVRAAVVVVVRIRILCHVWMAGKHGALPAQMPHLLLPLLLQRGWGGGSSVLCLPMLWLPLRLALWVGAANRSLQS